VSDPQVRPELFGALRRPYYLVAPDYTQISGGVRAMHYLCHALNLAGEDAYITTTAVHPELRTPTLVQSQAEVHTAAGRRPIAVYPEIVTGNPLGASTVARYLLAEPGSINGAQLELAPGDLVYTFGPSLVPTGWSAYLLRMPLVDTRVFHADGVDDATRQGSAVFINRHLDRGGSLDPITADSIEISRRVKERSATECADIFRQVECLYLYEFSTIVFEAILCGCPVVFIPNDVSQPDRDTTVWGGNGMAWNPSPAERARARATVGAARDCYAAEQREFWTQLSAFVDRTQSHTR